jgi:three-Cys-motif partner protein
VHRESPLGALPPHTAKKHEILRHYLDAYFPIIAQGFGASTEILYAEGFAGPGFYTGDDLDGSPIHALRAAYECDKALTARFKFVDEEALHVALLRESIDRLTSEEGVRDDIRIDAPEEGDSETILTPFIEKRIRENGRLGPALFFLDQFGFSKVTMAFVKRIMSQRACEVFVFLEMNRLRATLEKADLRESITAAFGDEGWMKAKPLSGLARQQFLRADYARCLKEHGGCVDVLDFTMRDNKDEIVSVLYFGTNDAAGLKAMKAAMNRADPSKTRSFADKSAGMGMLLDVGDDASSVADRIQAEFGGRDATLPEVTKFVMTKTGLLSARPSLALLEERGDLTVLCTLARRPKTYPWWMRNAMALHIRKKP